MATRRSGGWPWRVVWGGAQGSNSREAEENRVPLPFLLAQLVGAGVDQADLVVVLCAQDEGAHPEDHFGQEAGDDANVLLELGVEAGAEERRVEGLVGVDRLEAPEISAMPSVDAYECMFLPLSSTLLIVQEMAAFSEFSSKPSSSWRSTAGLKLHPSGSWSGAAFRGCTAFWSCMLEACTA